VGQPIHDNVDASMERRGITGLRKFILAAFASVSAGLLCWYGHLDGHEWMLSQTVILGLYKAADVLNRRSDNASSTS
jgi:hypothetical protein